MNELQLGHMEGWVGYQCCWQLQSIHIEVGFAINLIKAYVFWNKPIRLSFKHLKVLYVQPY